MSSLRGDRFDIRQLPGLVEERLLRAVETEDEEEILAGRQPALVLASRRLRSERDLHAAVGIHLHLRLVVGGQADAVLRIGYHRLGLHAVDDDRPEIAHRRIWGYAQPVGFLARKEFARVIAKAAQIGA